MIDSVTVMNHGGHPDRPRSVPANGFGQRGILRGKGVAGKYDGKDIGDADALPDFHSPPVFGLANIHVGIIAAKSAPGNGGGKRGGR